jgi:tRNA-specific 2-thiouridylase
VVGPYVADHAGGRTPNPCIECNRHIKFDRLLTRADQLGFDAVATGHHARVARQPDGGWSLRRGADPTKDQSYVLYMLAQPELARVRLPVGELTKPEVRRLALELGLRTATKPDSQDVCFISRQGGREQFLGDRIGFRPAQMVDRSGVPLGELPALELVTVGQRRGLGLSPAGPGTANRRYVVAVDMPAATVVVGSADDLLVHQIDVTDTTWVDRPPASGQAFEMQTSAHGRPVAARWASPNQVLPAAPVRRVAPGQSVVLYQGDAVVGGGLAV